MTIYAWIIQSWLFVSFAQLQISTEKRQLSNWANEWTRKWIEHHDILPPWSYLSIFICPMYFHATSFTRPLPHEYLITWPWKQLLPQESIRFIGKSLQYLNTLVGGPWEKCRINIWHWLPSREQTYPQIKGTFESMIFLFPRWDMFISWRVLFAYAWLVWGRSPRFIHGESFITDPQVWFGKDAMTKLDGQMIHGIPIHICI